MMAQALRDARFAARGMSKRPGFTALVVATLAVGLAATESRGGLVAAAVSLVAAVVFYRRRRAQVLVWFAVAVSVAAVWFTTSTAAWHRISHFDAIGTGRTDLWRVAWQAGKDRL